MSFNADNYISALEHPSVIINGRTYDGQLLSFAQWLPFESTLQRAAAGQLSNREMQTFYESFLRCVFPHRWSYKWHGDPVTLLMNSPALVPTIQHFFQLVVTALTNPQTETTTKNGGNTLHENPSVSPSESPSP